MSGTLKFRDEHGQWQEFRAARGRVGPPGPQGPPGTGVEIQGVVTTEADLPTSGDTGHAWLVVEPDQDYYGIVTDRPVLFVWDHVDTAWVPAGPLQGEPGPPGDEGPPGPPGDPATATPLAPAGGTNGTSSNAARQDHTHAGVYANAAHTHTSSDIVGTLDTNQIPALDAGKISSGTFSVSRIPNLDASKITSGKLNRDRIPNLTADIIVGGTFLEGLIPNLNANKITAGTLSLARVPTGTTAGTLALGNHTHRPDTMFYWTHQMSGESQILRTQPGYDAYAIGTVEIGRKFCWWPQGTVSSGGVSWRNVYVDGLGFGWLPQIGWVSI